MKKYLFALVCCLLFYACKHELERPTWDVDMIAPLVHTKMNINDLLTDSNLTINEDDEFTPPIDALMREYSNMNPPNISCNGEFDFKLRRILYGVS